MFAGSRTILAVLCIGGLVGCGSGTSKPLEETVEVEPGSFKIEAEQVEFETGDQGSAAVRLHRGEGFDEKVTFTFSPSTGLNANPTTYTPAEDEDTASTTLAAGKPGDYTIEVVAKPASGDEKKTTVKVKVVKGEDNET